jgi:uncharacterized membrane protein YhhN/GNAT superfamily N-acetyltransferase
MGTRETSSFHGYTFFYVAAGAAFLVLMAMDRGGMGRTVLKALPVSTLIVLVLRDIRGFPRIFMTGALLGSLCGDVLLDLPHPGLFIYGLVAFLIAHLFYTVLFFRYAKPPDAFQKIMIAGLILFAGLMVHIFRGIDPALLGPVVLYIVVIITMSAGALLVPAHNRLLFWGALLFIASDVVLAINKFLVAVPYGRVINISLYFLAQFFIVLAARRIWMDKGPSVLVPRKRIDWKFSKGFTPGAIGRVAELHGVYYHAHWGFGLFFEAKVAAGLSEFFQRYDESRDGFWTVSSGGRIEGSIAIDGIHGEREGAHLRWFIVSELLQGKGAGHQLIKRAMDFCRSKGYRNVYLWTFEGLNAARHLYEKHGFRLVREHQGTQWGTAVNEQRFECRLTGSPQPADKPRKDPQD